MDVMAGLLEGPRARNAFLLRTTMDPPWSMRIEDEAPLTLVAIVRGAAWVTVGADEVRLGAGDVAVVCGPDHYTVADDVATAPQIRILPGQECVTLTDDPLSMTMDLGVRSWGNAVDGTTMMLTGTYEGHSALSQELLGALPAVVVVRRDERDAPLVDLLRTEITRDEPGQQVVLDRLLDLLLVDVLRTWLTRQGSGAPAWWRASRDPIVGAMMRLVHDEPARPWTIAAMASSIGVSRANLARRFTELVGEPPIAYLTRWRLALAADLLCDPRATVTGVAPQVGYGSPFALSTAFKRAYGISPAAHRAGATRRADGAA
ncbi:MAG: AraC family transcriptional regulator [Ilumatobacteraceae bacterium]